MSAKQTDAATDLKPWAAYVVGRHPHVIAMRMELMWSYRRAGDREQDPDRVNDISTEMNELDAALKELADAGHFQQRQLLEFSHAWEKFARQYEEFLETAAWSAPRDWMHPGQATLQRMLELLPGLVPTAQGAQRHLHRWCEIGVAVGRTQYRLEHGPYTNDDAATSDLDAVPGAVRSASEAIGNSLADHVDRLVADVRRLMTARPLPEMVRPAMEAFLKLDQHLQRSLRRWPLPEPVLILTQDTITLSGQSRRLARFPRTEMACLWVLAEHAGEDMERQAIIDEGGIKTDIEYLKSTVSRLNKTLRKLAGTSYPSPAAVGGGASKDDNLIAGIRVSGGFGPYRLQIDPQRVRVDCRRPRWMKQRPPT